MEGPHVIVAAGLVGREAELDRLDGLLGGAPERGASLVLRGEPGLGKTALLAAIAERAADLGWLVLRTAGIPAETGLPLAALHNLLRPVMGDVDRLPPPQRHAILGAFGLLDTPTPEMFRVALAVLDLLGRAATTRPVAVLIDDAHWLDRSSAEVLAFIARRVDSDPIVMLAATRPVDDDVFTQSALPELVLGALDDTASEALLDSAGTDMSPRSREAMLAAAAGNPLALIELPKAGDHADESGVLPGLLPLTDRLERAFAARASTLPTVARDLLLLVALNDSDSLAEVLAAQTVMRSSDAEIDDFHAAVSAGLVDLDLSKVHFRHPLMRSAIHQSASVGRRQAGHAALAEVLAEEPVRQLWHRAASVVGANEEVASELEQAALRAQQRSTIPVAVNALARAAELSGTHALRGRRLVRAAELSYEMGRTSLSERLLHEAASVELDAHERLRLEAVRELSDSGMHGGAPRVDALIELSGQARTWNDTELAVRFLLRAGRRCWHLTFGPEVEQRVIAATDELTLAETDPRRLVIHAYASPLSRGKEVMDVLGRRPPRRGDDPSDLLLLGHAAACVGSFHEAEVFLAAAADGLREQGRLALLSQALGLMAWSAVRRSRWHVAAPAAEECVRLAEDTRQPVAQLTGLAAQAMIAGIRGDEEATKALAERAERLGVGNRVSIGLAIVQTARAMSDAGAGRPADAFDQLWRIYQITDPAHQRMQACWAIGSLAEVAVQSGQRQAARSELAKLEPLAAETPSQGVHVALRYARALLAEPEDSERFFREALEADLTDWPFEHGRALLAYGSWLRRERRVTESRRPLRAACEEFDRTGALRWAERARGELRAAGETTGSPVRNAWDTLSPQEMQIAQLVAEGLANKEIGQRLYLSHRTVGTHLYRIFPKLGVTSRAQLAKALPASAAYRS